MMKYVVDKSDYTGINVDFGFRNIDASFDARVHGKNREAFDSALVEAGLRLVQQKTFNIPIDD